MNLHSWETNKVSTNTESGTLSAALATELFGANKSSTANVAAATRAKAKAASKSGFCFGRTKAAKATIKPSRTYFTTRLHNSRASNIFNIYIIDKKKKKIKF